MALTHLQLRPFLARVAKTALAVAAAATVSLAPQMSHAENKPNDIYIAVLKENVARPIVVFVFSDSTKGGYTPIDGVAYYTIKGYVPEERFDPGQGCDYTADFPLEMADGKIGAKPIYGPNSEQRTIDPFSLPSYMAREVVRRLGEEGVATTEAEQAPYFNCAGAIWASILGRDSVELEKKIREQFEEQIIKKQ